jgi:N-acetyltransferase
VFSSSPSRTTAIFSDRNVPDDWTPPSSPNLVVSNAIGTNIKNGKDLADAPDIALRPGRLVLHAVPASNGRPLKVSKPKQSTTAQEKATITKKKKPRAKPLTQMRLDLGQQIQKRCQTCGMEYRPALAEDKKLHNKFHSQIVRGIPINSKLQLRLRMLENEVNLCTQEIIQPIDHRLQSWAPVRKLVPTVLDMVEKELGGVGIDIEKLWGQVEMPAKEGGQEEKDSTLCNRYKTFLFIRKNKILGVCLVERIFEAYPVLPIVKTQSDTSTAVSDAAITTSEQAQPAQMGISRIWVSKCARGQGIANELLRFAAKTFIYRVNIPKERIAFSQPTESGAKLARKFFGTDSGWLVYHG